MEKESDRSYVNRLSEELLMIPVEQQSMNERAIKMNNYYSHIIVMSHAHEQ